MPSYLPRTMLTLVLLAFGGQAVASPQECAARSGVLFSECEGTATARLLTVGEGGVEGAARRAGTRRVTVTAAYTSGEKREPEGLFFLGGEAVDPYPQGWDGVALIDGKGRLTLHHAERIGLGRERWNLRTRWSRRAFAKAARARGWSAFQSHLIVVDGDVDTRPREGAPRFTRRILYTLEDGTVGLYETAPMTLHDAAVAVDEALSPVMALNLDMGSYDYCRIEDDTGERNCGVLAASQTGKLSNLLVLTQEVGEEMAATE